MLGKRQPSLRHRAGLLVAAVGLLCGPPLAAPEAQSVTSAQGPLIREYVDAFSPHGMVAVLIPIGQEPGDVLDRLGEEFVHRRRECFSNLAVDESPSSLPNFDLGAGAALRLGLGLQQIGDAEVHALGDNRVILRFDRVTVQTVSQGQLRQAVNRRACPEVARLVDKDPKALTEGRLLVGEVFRARSIVRVNRDSGGGGSFSLSGLRALAARFGLRLRADGGGDLEAAQAVELSSTEPLPVAFRPAFIRLDPSQPGYRAAEGRPGAQSIVPFNPDSESDRLALRSWIERSLPTATGATH